MLLGRQIKPMHLPVSMLTARKKLAFAFAFAWMTTQHCNRIMYFVGSCLLAVLDPELVSSANFACWMDQYVPTTAWGCSSTLLRLNCELMFNESQLN